MENYQYNKNTETSLNTPHSMDSMNVESSPTEFTDGTTLESRDPPLQIVIPQFTSEELQWIVRNLNASPQYGTMSVESSPTEFLRGDAPESLNLMYFVLSCFLT